MTCTSSRACAARAADPRRVVGVRWASRPDIGFPLRLWPPSPRGCDVPHRTVLPARSRRPGAAFLGRRSRRKPLRGPWFPSIEEADLGYLLPIVRLADPRTPRSSSRPRAQGQPTCSARFTSPTPRWRGSSGPPGARRRSAICSPIRHRPRSHRVLPAKVCRLPERARARFEYAVLFGLATDHLVDDDRGLSTRSKPTGVKARASRCRIRSTPRAVRADGARVAHRRSGSGHRRASRVREPRVVAPARVVAARRRGQRAPGRRACPRAPAAFTRSRGLAQGPKRR